MFWLKLARISCWNCVGNSRPNRSVLLAYAMAELIKDRNGVDVPLDDCDVPLMEAAVSAVVLKTTCAL